MPSLAFWLINSSACVNLEYFLQVDLELDVAVRISWWIPGTDSKLCPINIGGGAALHVAEAEVSDEVAQPDTKHTVIEEQAVCQHSHEERESPECEHLDYKIYHPVN